MGVRTTGDPVSSDSTGYLLIVAEGLLPLLWPLTVFTRIALGGDFIPDPVTLPCRGVAAPRILHTHYMCIDPFPLLTDCAVYLYNTL